MGYNSLMLWKIDGYLVIPHELLHVLAYRLIGKRCHYRLGGHFVNALEPCTFRERIFVLLLPLIVIGGTAFTLLFLWAAIYWWVRFPPNPLTYFQVAPLWHQSLWVAAIILLLYSGSAVFDVVIVFRLLLQKLRQQPPDQTDDDQTKWESPQEAD